MNRTLCGYVKGMARTKKPQPVKTFRHSADAPEPCQAAQVAILTMKALKVSKWAQVVEIAATGDVRATVTLTPVQQSLLDRYAHLLPYLRVRPLQTVVACTVCGLHGITGGTGTIPRNCYFTLGCEGQLVKASSMAARAA